MLTPADLKAIKKVVREEVEVEVRSSTNKLNTGMKLSRMQIQNEIHDVSDQVKNVQIQVNRIDNRLQNVESHVEKIDNRLQNVDARLITVEKDVKNIKKRVKKVERTTDVMIRSFNSDDIKLQKRVTRIKKHLQLPTGN